jgi:periplasmic protein TonB
METTMSTSDPLNDGTGPASRQSPDERAAGGRAPGWRSSRRVLVSVGVAFAIGALLFTALWWRDRDNDFYRAEDLPQTVEGQQFEPLPTPAPADGHGDSASGMGETPMATEMPAPRPVQTRPAPAPASRPLPPSPADRAAPTADAAPEPIASPAPSYPSDALRNRESGTVVLRVHVDANGSPYAVDLLQSSRSRSLDRAATQAVKRWRFRPALRGGQPVPGEIQVPISFNAER